MKTDVEDHLAVVYVIGSDQSGPVKIGITGQMPLRLNQFQVGSPEAVKVFGVRFASAEPESGKYSIKAMFRRGAQILEARVHAKLKEFDLHVRGEWFDVTAGEALEVIDKVGKTQGPIAIGLTDLMGADLSGSCDPRMKKMHYRLMHEALAINSFVLKNNGVDNEIQAWDV